MPLISLDAWLLAGPSLLGLFLAQGSNDPLSITIRYTLLVVPGFSLEALFWWQQRPQSKAGRTTKLAWGAAISLSLLLTVSSNPHRSFSFVIPDSVSPWVYSSPLAQWHHGWAAREALAIIPSDASVSANTQLIPLLAQRKVAVRYPYDISYLHRQGQETPVEWIALDLDCLERYGVAFGGDWKTLSRLKRELPAQLDTYRVQAFKDGVAVLQHNGALNPALQQALVERMKQPLPQDPKKR